VTRREELVANLAAVEQRISAACAAAGRSRDEVTLIAVSKTWPVDDIALLRDLGVRDFGENRDQEAGPKAAALPDVRWHFVGAVQTNKARRVAAYADVVHSVDRLGLVTALSAGAERAQRVVEVLVQVSLDGSGATSQGRGGALPDDVPEIADAAAEAAGLRLGGVMAIAPLGVDPAAAFGRLAEVAATLRAAHPEARTISAGMSGDLESAVAAGANALRVGTALLGHRTPLTR
jgi:pyridoxal phosphate enzyme (YggS family)